MTYYLDGKEVSLRELVVEARRCYYNCDDEHFECVRLVHGEKDFLSFETVKFELK